MELKSLSYLVFISIVVLLYFSVHKWKNAQKYVLLCANLLFIYAASGIRSLCIIIILTIVSYMLGRSVEKDVLNKRKEKAKITMLIGVFFSVGILCYFKFFKESFDLVRNFAMQHSISLSPLVTPIGISYFSLTMIAYVLDIYHKKHESEKSFLDYLTFITYFPSIIEGPINLYKKTAYQIKETHKFDTERVIKGAQRLLWGYVKKIIIADRIGILVTAILQDELSSGFILLWAMVLYSFQIYADFSGGIDVIMGITEILDIKLTENFHSPLVSKSVTEYWKRWHISLGEFMEKYIYYPIVLNRRVMKFSKKISNKYLQKVFSATLASVIVFVIVGIWHGTGWNYVVYGCYQAFFVSSAILMKPIYKKVTSILRLPADSISWNLFRVGRTFIILTLGRYFIRAHDLTQAIALFKKTCSGLQLHGLHILFDDSLFQYGLDYKNVILMYIGILLMIIVDIVHENKVHIREIIMKQDIVFRYVLYLLAIFSIIIFGIYGPEFSGSSFIYAEF